MFFHIKKSTMGRYLNPRNRGVMGGDLVTSQSIKHRAFSTACQRMGQGSSREAKSKQRWDIYPWEPNMVAVPSKRTAGVATAAQLCPRTWSRPKGQRELLEADKGNQLHSSWKEEKKGKENPQAHLTLRQPDWVLSPN